MNSLAPAARTPAKLQAAPHAGRPLRILALGPQDVCPPIDGGKEGIHGALKALADRATVSYAYPRSTADTRAAYAAIGVEAVPVDHQPRDSLSTIVAATVRGRPFKFYKYGTRRALDALERAIGPAEFDAVVCFHSHMAELGHRLRRSRGWTIPLVVREHNIEYELVRSYRAALSPLQRLVALPFEYLTQRDEQRIWRRADAVAFLSVRDLRTAQETGVPGRLFLAPEGIPIPPDREPRRPAGPARLLVPLNAKAAQSVTNLAHFLRTFWSEVSRRETMREVSLGVTGVQIERLAELTGFSIAELATMRVEALGFLPSLAPAFAQSLAVVSPTFAGGGIRKKVLEAMANQVPVIATDLDISTGDFFDPPRNILRMADPDGFAESVEWLLGDDRHWQELADAGRATVMAHASWPGFADAMLAEINRLARPRAGSSTAKPA